MIKNAVEASFEGEVVIVELKKDKEFGYISIIDKGIGMSEEVLNKLGTQLYSL